MRKMGLWCFNETNMIEENLNWKLVPIMTQTLHFHNIEYRLQNLEHYSILPIDIIILPGRYAWYNDIKSIDALF